MKGYSDFFKLMFKTLVLCAVVLLHGKSKVSADDFDQLDTCSVLFHQGSLAEGTIERLAEIPFPLSSARPAVTNPQDQRQLAEAGKLMKWDRDLRLIVVSDDRLPSDVLYSTYVFKDRLGKTIGRDRSTIVWNPVAPFKFRRGDILLLLSSHPLATLRKDARIMQLLQDLYGSGDEYSSMVARLTAQADQSLVELVDVENLMPDRAAIIFNTNQAVSNRRHNLFKFLTFASSPNPKAPSRPDIVFRSGFEAEAQFDPAWSRLYRIFLVLVFEPEIAAGMTRDEFVDQVNELVKRPALVEELRAASDCEG